MAKIYAVLTKIVFALGIFGLFVSWLEFDVNFFYIILGFLGLFVYCFPGLVIADLQGQVTELQNKINSLQKPSSTPSSPRVNYSYKASTNETTYSPGEPDMSGIRPIHFTDEEE